MYQSRCLACSKKTVELIVEQGNDFLITVKKNQPKLYSALETAFEENPPASVERQRQQAHGRDIERVVSVLLPPDDIDLQWVGIKRIIKVERSGTRGKKPFEETMFYVCSLEKDAPFLAQLIQRHWHIENRLHWPKDVVLKEDSTPTCDGRAIEAFAIIRTIVLNLFRSHGWQSITEAIDQVSHDIPVLFSFFQ